MIRRAGLDDAEALARLERECFDEPWTSRMILGELEARGRIHLVHENGGEIRGYLLAMQILDEIHVNKIGTSPELRRRGIARDLMTALEAEARAHAVTLISLEVRSRNQGARSFYRSLGFDEEYVRRRYYPNGDDAIVMSRMLER